MYHPASPNVIFSEYFVYFKNKAILDLLNISRCGLANLIM